MPHEAQAARALRSKQVPIQRQRSPLALLMARVRANYIHRPLSADDLAVFTDTLDAGANFHGNLTQQLFSPAGRKHVNVTVLRSDEQVPRHRIFTPGERLSQGV
jgi:hypothetical protein